MKIFMEEPRIINHEPRILTNRKEKRRVMNSSATVVENSHDESVRDTNVQTV